MRLVSALLVIIFIAHPVCGASKSVTLYLDGARTEQVLTVIKDSADIPLPVAYKEGSMRIKPLDDCQIEKVETVQVKSDPKITREIARLNERREKLNDRLKALELRESIFTSAARAQSGKAPRKTKSNPEPLAAVKQGTEFALSQLEGVYRTRRTTQAELKNIDERVESIKKISSNKLVKTKLSRKGCRINIAYLRVDYNWVPNYDFRIDNSGEGAVFIRAILPRFEKGIQVSVAPSAIAEGVSDGKIWPILDENTGLVASLRFPVKQDKFSSKPISSITFIFKNQSALKLPPGEATCYFRGEYLGKSNFKGADPGESSELTFGY